MTRELTPHQPELSLAQRVRRALAQNQTANGTCPQQQSPPTPISKALLLDVSGSMDEPSEDPRVRKIDALRALVEDMHLPGRQAVYAFSDSPAMCTPATIPEPCGNTYICRAFRRAKQDKHQAAVIITDGLPTDPIAALREAKGLTLEIFYVGPAPKPRFLDELARACGGRAHQTNLRKDQRRQLSTRIRGLLEAGK